MKVPVRKWVRGMCKNDFAIKRTDGGLVLTSVYPKTTFKGGKRSILVKDWVEAKKELLNLEYVHE